MDLLRKILLPFVPVYFLVTWLRNIFYDKGLYGSTSYEIPIIKVGNLSVGGTGKTPMVEYLVRLLNNSFRVATLSRGYKRSTDGFVLANKNTNLNEIGDEPYQLLQKFERIQVAVDANRRRGISTLMDMSESAEIILMDDAFQHRKVASGLNILLTAYSNLYCDDIVLPTGNLREPRSGAKRANIIVVTKCPNAMTAMKKNQIKQKLKPRMDQHVFFSSINYSNSIIGSDGSKVLSNLKTNEFTLVTGIANAEPLVEFLKNEGLQFEHLEYDDHHNFTAQDVLALNTKKVLLTTEKDYWRLHGKITTEMYYLPIEIVISEGNTFNGLITNYVSNSRLS